MTIVTTTDTIPPTILNEILNDVVLRDMLFKIYCRYCATEIWLDYSDFDYADPNAKPVPRNVTGDNNEYHNCISKKMVRLYERGLLP
jgi:ribosomal protein S18